MRIHSTFIDCVLFSVVYVRRRWPFATRSLKAAVSLFVPFFFFHSFHFKSVFFHCHWFLFVFFFLFALWPNSCMCRQKLYHSSWESLSKKFRFSFAYKTLERVAFERYGEDDRKKRRICNYCNDNDDDKLSSEMCNVYAHCTIVINNQTECSRKKMKQVAQTHNELEPFEMVVYSIGLHKLERAHALFFSPTHFMCSFGWFFLSLESWAFYMDTLRRKGNAELRQCRLQHIKWLQISTDDGFYTIDIFITSKFFRFS